MKYTVLLLAIFPVLLTQNGKVEALLTVSMDDPRSVIDVKGPSSGNLSSGILKSHFGQQYTTGRNKTLILRAPPGFGMMASFRYLQFGLFFDKLTVYAVNYAQPPRVFDSTVYQSSEELLTYNAPNGQLAVEFYTEPGIPHSMAGFQLTFTVYSTSSCGDGTFRCSNGYCIASILRCDGHNHCGDLSDQFSCSSDTGNVGSSTIIGIVFGVIFLLIAVSCAIFIIVRRASRR